MFKSKNRAIRTLCRTKYEELLRKEIEIRQCNRGLDTTGSFEITFDSLYDDRNSILNTMNNHRGTIIFKSSTGNGYISFLMEQRCDKQQALDLYNKLTKVIDNTRVLWHKEAKR